MLTVGLWPPCMGILRCTHIHKNCIPSHAHIYTCVCSHTHTHTHIPTPEHSSWLGMYSSAGRVPAFARKPRVLVSTPHKPSTVTHAHKPSTQEVGTGQSVQSYPQVTERVPGLPETHEIRKHERKRKRWGIGRFLFTTKVKRKEIQYTYLLASHYLYLLTPLGGAGRLLTACLFLITKWLSQGQAAAL